MASLSQFVFDEQQTPPALTQANAALSRESIEAGQAQEHALAARKFRTRTVPDLIRRRAARGSFFSGGTSEDVAREATKTVERFGEGRAQATEKLADVLRNQFLDTIGLEL